MSDWWASGQDVLATPITRIEHADEAERAEALAFVLAGLTGPLVRTVRVGNPLRAGLTLERLAMQACGPVDEPDPATALAAELTRRAGAESDVVLVIERAESLEPDVLPALEPLTLPHPDAPRLHIVLVGAPVEAAVMEPAIPPAEEPDRPRLDAPKLDLPEQDLSEQDLSAQDPSAQDLSELELPELDLPEPIVAVTGLSHLEPHTAPARAPIMPLPEMVEDARADRRRVWPVWLIAGVALAAALVWVFRDRLGPWR